jgi:hypothetical protein
VSRADGLLGQTTHPTHRTSNATSQEEQTPNNEGQRRAEKPNQPATEPSRERPAAETRREIRREIEDGSKEKKNEERMKK